MRRTFYYSSAFPDIQLFMSPRDIDFTDFYYFNSLFLLFQDTNFTATGDNVCGKFREMKDLVRIFV